MRVAWQADIGTNWFFVSACEGCVAEPMCSAHLTFPGLVVQPTYWGPPSFAHSPLCFLQVTVYITPGVEQVRLDVMLNFSLVKLQVWVFVLLE